MVVVAVLQLSFRWEGGQLEWLAILPFSAVRTEDESSPRTVEMELFAGFNAEELAMMQELLRLLLEDDDALTQQPTPRTSARQDSQALFDGLAGGTAVNGFSDYQYGVGVPNGMAWNAPPAMMAPTPQYGAKASRVRTRSNFASDDEPTLKRGRVDVAPAMRTPVNYVPFPERSRAGHPYY